MGALQNFERRLEQAISGAFAKAFRSAVQPVEIAAALQRECDNNAQILVPRPADGAQPVPRRALRRPTSSGSRRTTPRWPASCATSSRTTPSNQGYVFPGPISIGFEAAEDLTTGRFRIRSEAQAQVRSNSTQTQVRRATALVEVNGTQHPLHPPAMVVGRGTEADIRINDPGISRRHIEFQVAGAGDDLQLRVRDLGSTNGMLVDGHRVASTGAARRLRGQDRQHHPHRPDRPEDADV